LIHFNFINFIDFVTSVYISRLPEDDVNTLKLVAVLYKTDIALNILCICWSK